MRAGLTAEPARPRHTTTMRRSSGRRERRPRMGGSELYTCAPDAVALKQGLCRDRGAPLSDAAKTLERRCRFSQRLAVKRRRGGSVSEQRPPREEQHGSEPLPKGEGRDQRGDEATWQDRRQGQEDRERRCGDTP